jgi:hypothetical protein
MGEVPVLLYEKEIFMPNPSTHSLRFPIFKRLWKPAAVTGAGGTAIAIWFEELIAFATDFIGVILLTILGGLICLFDTFIFKSRIPRGDDLQDIKNNGVKK